MTRIKKIRDVVKVGFLACAFVFATGTGLTYADYDLSGSNDTTGPNSENENEWDIDEDFDIDLDNDVDFQNDLDLDLETGENDVEGNTFVDDFATGDIEGDFELVNEYDLPQVVFSGSGNGREFSFDFENYLTGPYSENENKAEIDLDFDLDVDNDVDFDNDIDLDLNTGNNDVRNNTQVGDVETGDIEVTARVENSVDLGGDFDLCDTCLGLGEIEADFSNELTGPNSENKNELDIQSDVDIDVNNNVDVNNDIDVDANTGENDVECNTVVGDIETGDIELDFQVTNRIN